MQETIPPGQQLCQSCGLCCQGVFYSHVEARSQAEKQRLLDQGFLLASDGASAHGYFNQPCKAFVGNCSIYEERPANCASFSCRLLSEYQEEKVSLEQAADVIMQMKEALSHLDELLPEDPEPCCQVWPKARMAILLKQQKQEQGNASGSPDKPYREALLAYSVFDVLRQRRFADKPDEETQDIND